MIKRVISISIWEPILSINDSLTGVRHNRTPVLSYLASRVAKFALGATILFIPFRLRINLFEQPIGLIYGDYTNGLIFLADFFLILTLIAWGIDLISRPRPISYQPWIISLPMAGLLLISLISVVTSVNPLISTYHIVRMLFLACFYLYILNEIHDIRTIIGPLAIGVAIQAAVGITQVMLQRSIGLQAFGEYPLDPDWRGVSIVYAEGVRSLRSYGLSDHPNILGGCLAFGLVILIVWQVMNKPARGFIIPAAILVGLPGLLLTFSRSAWLGFAIGLFVITAILFLKRDYHPIVHLIQLGIASLFLLAPFIVFSLPYLGVRLNRTNSFQQNASEVRAFEERARLNAAGNQIFVENALIGVGLGASPIALMEHEPVFPYYYQPPHNTFLEAAVETGIFGALFYGILLVGPWLVLWWRRKRLELSPAFLGSVGALAAITIVGFFDYYPWLLSAGRYWHFLIWGLWGAFYTKSIQKK